MAAVTLYRQLASLRAVAVLLGVAASSVWRWSKSNCVAKGWARNGPEPKFTEQLRDFLKQLVARWPCLTQHEMAMRIHGAFDIRVSRRLVSVALKRANFTKKRARCRLAPVTPTAHTRRQEFATGLMEAFRRRAPVVAVDESGFDQRPRHTVYAYAPSGVRAILIGRPCTSRRHTSMVAAIASDAFTDGTRMFSRLTDAAVTATTFAEFLSALPCPHGATLVMDNASIHKSRVVREVAIRRGFTLLFCPPYSPEFNPIEYVFSVVKRHFYRRRYDDDAPAGGRFEVHSAIDEARTAVAAATVDAVFSRVRRLASEELTDGRNGTRQS